MPVTSERRVNLEEEHVERKGGFSFALIVVLFILLIIVGTAYVGNYGGGGGGDPVFVGFGFFPFFW